jgi:hypothetical protein
MIRMNLLFPSSHHQNIHFKKLISQKRVTIIAILTTFLIIIIMRYVSYISRWLATPLSLIIIHACVRSPYYTIITYMLVLHHILHVQHICCILSVLLLAYPGSSEGSLEGFLGSSQGLLEEFLHVFFLLVRFSHIKLHTPLQDASLDPTHARDCSIIIH